MTDMPETGNALIAALNSSSSPSEVPSRIRCRLLGSDGDLNEHRLEFEVDEHRFIMAINAAGGLRVVSGTLPWNCDYAELEKRARAALNREGDTWQEGHAIRRRRNQQRYRAVHTPVEMVALPEPAPVSRPVLITKPTPRERAVELAYLHPIPLYPAQVELTPWQARIVAVVVCAFFGLIVWASGADWTGIAAAVLIVAGLLWLSELVTPKTQ